jgi:hypothetical protein
MRFSSLQQHVQTFLSVAPLVLQPLPAGNLGHLQLLLCELQWQQHPSEALQKIFFVVGSTA